MAPAVRTVLCGYRRATAMTVAETGGRGYRTSKQYGSLASNFHMLTSSDCNYPFSAGLNQNTASSGRCKRPMIRSGTTNPYIRAFHQRDATSQPKPDASSSNVDGSGIGTKSYCSLDTAVVPEKLAMNALVVPMPSKVKLKTSCAVATF
jgi:hypothetical protein